MNIARIQIEEGFLDGLDVNLTPGLNVVIGARGTGKTSLIELLRFCLGVEGNTAESARRSRDHALSVLGSGQITVTLYGNAGPIYVSRAANDPQPRSSGPFPSPIIFSQTEIETIGLQASGRLQLIDSFLSSETGKESEQAAIAEFASTNVELEKIRKELEEVDRQVATVAAVQAELLTVVAAEAALSQTSQVISAKTALIDNLTKAISHHGVVVAEGQRINNSLAVWYEQIKNVIAAAPSAVTPATQHVFPYIVEEVSKTQGMLTDAMNHVSSVYHRAKATIDSNSAEKIVKEDQARVIRKEVEGLSEGAGQVLRKGQQLREQQAKLESVAEYQKVKQAAMERLVLRRRAALDKLDTIRNLRFNARQDVVNRLNQRLGPRIRIEIVRCAQVQGFAVAVGDALKGSNLRYADIAKAIAENLTPRALLEAVDTFDHALISRVAEIVPERAARVLTHLRSTDLGRLGSFEIEDNVTFQLLDGRDFKDFNALSTGQRCTVVLPLVLAHQHNLIVVDQPEDHIDNAFIADTLIKAILARDIGNQILFTTHNPNIPVLGEADNVIHLSSDGRRGFCRTVGDLAKPEVIEAISNVMEGGSEAFAKRSNFYAILDII